MQVCIKCGISKPLSEFYAHKQMALGVDSKCKECAKALARQRRIDNPEKARDIDHRKYMKRREAHQERHREWVAKHPEKMVEYKNEWRRRNKEKQSAHNAVQRAIRDSVLPRASTLPCNRCDDDAQEYHHWSYDPDHWFDVEALCTRCHGLADIERRELEVN